MAEFAPGIKSKQNLGDILSLPEDDIATLVRQKHQADKAGLHEDLRIGTPSGMLSWAVPKFLPEDDSKRLAIQQPVHDWSYNDFEGRLGHGYGKGVVSRMEKSPVVILKRSPDHIMFTRGDSKTAPVYQLVRTKDKNWLLFKKRQEQPEVIAAYPKEHFKMIPMDSVPALIENGASITPKIDGAGALAYLGPKGISVYGIRTNQQGLKPEYTDYIGGLHSYKVPKELEGTVLRGELYGKRRGAVIGANELAGILNSTLYNAVNKRKAEGIQLMLAALAVNKNKVDQYRKDEVADIVNRLAVPAITTVPEYKGDDALKLLDSIRRKKNLLTDEGVVLHVPGKRPLKAKNISDADVIIRSIFKADTEGEQRAGGFAYSLPGSDKIIGRVGTGLSHAMLKDMLLNPANYIGRTARIHSQEQYPSGAYRAPAFLSMKED